MFSSPSGGDQFISWKTNYKYLTLRVFSSPSGGDQFISLKLSDVDLQALAEFSSPSGGDQFISSGG